MIERAASAVAPLVIVFALIGCGGSQPTSTTPRAPEAGGGFASQQELEKRVEEIRKQRASKHSQQLERGDTKRSERVRGHHDSGGGARQFMTPGGDNSVPEYGTEASSRDRARAATVLHAYLDSEVVGDWAGACAYLSASMVGYLESVSQAGQRECPTVLREINSNASRESLQRAAKVDVGSLRVEGQQGFLIFFGPEQFPFAMPVVEEDGEWRLSALEGTPLS